MTQPREIEGVLDRWFADGPRELSDRALVAALSEIDHTRQLGAHAVPWRFSEMPTPVRLLLVAALMAVSAGAALFIAGTQRDSPTPTPTPSPIADGPGVPIADYAPGDQIRLSARLTELGEPIKGLGTPPDSEVVARLVRPDAGGIGDLLSSSTASSTPSPAPDQLSPADTKLFNTLKTAPLPFNDQDTVKLVDDGSAASGDAVAGDGVYSALFPAQLIGHHNFLFGVTGTAAVTATIKHGTGNDATDRYQQLAHVTATSTDWVELAGCGAVYADPIATEITLFIAGAPAGVTIHVDDVSLRTLLVR